MVVGAIDRLVRSRVFLCWGLAFLVGFWGAYFAPALYVWAFPPHVSHSLEVIVEGGVPVRVIEIRDIRRSFAGEWRVKVIDLDRGKVRCDLPPGGPRRQAYNPSPTSAFEPSWDGYTGHAADCLAEMLQHPGRYVIETHRRAWVWWRWVDLPARRSVLSFEVGMVPPGAGVLFPAPSFFISARPPPKLKGSET